MVAAASFVIGFVLIGLAVVLIAMRGGPRGAREGMHSQSPLGRSFATWAIALTCLAFGIAIPAVVMAANSNNDEQSRGGVKLTADQAAGRRLFAYNCGTCHTLKAASTAGRVGPNLDELRPPKALVLDAIAKGRARGDGQMPGDLLVGDEADKVASFIEAVAGR
ncbi:MAG: c-type cytochrome [Solirubrobacteraceae bacterium]